VLSIFVVELLIQLYAQGPAYFRDSWNVFDIVVVGIALAPASQGFAATRALRVLRAFRLVFAVLRMRGVVEALLRAVPGIADRRAADPSVLCLRSDRDQALRRQLSGMIRHHRRSMFSLFQIMTLESWSMRIVRPVMAV